MYAVCVTFDIAPDHWADFLPLMEANADASLTGEPGCVRFDICHNGRDQVFLYEHYTDAAAFDAHLAAPHFLAFSEATAAMITGKRVATYDSVREAAP